jgi:hypothetical protein
LAGGCFSFSLCAEVAWDFFQPRRREEREELKEGIVCICILRALRAFAVAFFHLRLCVNPLRESLAIAKKLSKSAPEHVSGGIGSAYQ